MSEQTEQTEPEPQNEPHGNSEAAKWRRQLRETETERDALRGRLDQRDRQDIERLATQQLVNPSDLWMVSSIDKMRAEDGTIDMARAEAELQRVVTERPHWAARPPVDLHQGVRENVETQPPPPSFGEALLDAKGGE